MAFPKGEKRPAGAGRKPGTPNKVTADLKDMILTALDSAGGAAYLTEQARETPAAFMALVGRCLPKDVSVDHKGNVTVGVYTGVPPPRE